MSSDSVQKFVLKSTTKVSLNERFTNVMMIKQSAPVNITATIRQQHTASARNRRLAQQMENRPSVQAALQQQQSLKQRLGTTNIQARLGRPMGSLRGGGTGQWVPMGGLRGKTRGGIRSRGLRGRCSFDGLGRGWGRGRGRGRGRGQGRGVGRPAVTREQLDNQLDAYMSKSKWYLDAELDAYMAQTDPEGLV